MGHLAAKDLYGELGRKADGLHVRAPGNETFLQILKELYSAEEADVVVKMPYVFSSLERISALTGIEKGSLERILDGLSLKGLVIDFDLGGGRKYMPSPLVIGIFEFTMMRTDGGVDFDRVAPLFRTYMDEGAFYRANFGAETRVSFARALPHEEALAEHVEVLDYEKAANLVDEAGTIGVGLCSCRHKKEHAGEERCDVPLETCTVLGKAARYLIKNRMAREIPKAEMHDVLARSRERGLVLAADNVQKRPMFICHCCACCCGILDGLNKHGLPTTLVTSSFLPKRDADKCIGCSKCAKACHVHAMRAPPAPDPGVRGAAPALDESFCIGCGVCVLKCPAGALELVRRPQQVLHPATTFERVILQCLEGGTLQNQIFDNPESLTQDAMRGLIGGFLRLPAVKKALMSDLLRSTFLRTMAAGVSFLGKGYLHEL
ncbi:MAG: 4Fe-4S binding protein [Deltaproteobacteria bacterium]|nr:4Fe-4S binding protein [Deltaproteobacteria bacterium]